MLHIQSSDILLITDVCETFMPGEGPRLAVPGGAEVVPVILEIMPMFPRKLRIATKERHPWGHIALASSYRCGLAPMTVMTQDLFMKLVREYGPAFILQPHAKFTLEDVRAYLNIVGHFVLWPNHGLAGTDEAEIHPDIPRDEIGYELVKGMDPREHAFSPFAGDRGTPTELEDVMCGRGGKRVFGVGLAFDYCVGWGLVHAALRGFEAYCIEDACRAVNMPEGSVANMQERFAKHNVGIIQSGEVRRAA